jgi:CO dehydrogenase/acetyl-CoA synthase delta subunit
MKIFKKETSCCAQSCDCSDTLDKYTLPSLDRSFITGNIETPIGKIPVVSTTLSTSDKWDNLKRRLNIRRMDYKVDPGLYAVGKPDNKSNIFVSANYKMSFDVLRRALDGSHAWILVIDTRGINVWCAAGKGTFGTQELVNRIEVSGLKEIIAHRKLIVPQLGAVGVSAHKVKKKTGFMVIYGPVRVSDLPAFLQSGMKATPKMRHIDFNFHDRLEVMPVEAVQGLRYLFIFGIFYYIIAGFTAGKVVFNWTAGLYPLLSLAVAYVAGTILGPLMLPWLPGRSFSIKGTFAGLIGFAVLFFTNLIHSSSLEMTAWFLVTIALASFLTMNFTGASTYTSFSGVKKEMKIAIPIQATALVLGVLIWVAGRFHIL